MATPEFASEDLVHVRVSVHIPGGDHFAGDATVVLSDRHSGAAVSLRRKPGSPLFGGMVPPGNYDIEVEAADWVAPPRTIEVGAAGKTASIYLGRDGWPVFRMGETPVPYEPLATLVSIAFLGERPDPAANETLVRDLETHLKMKQVAAIADGSMITLEMPGGEGRTDMLAQIPPLLPPGIHNVRIGMPISTGPSQAQFLDDRYVVRFRDSVSADLVEELLVAANATKLRDFIQAPNAWLILFGSGDPLDHQAVIDGWFEQNLLIYGEPDLPLQIVDDAFLVDDPGDQEIPNQENLPLQGVQEAWRFLHDEVNIAWALGNPAVCVATLDRGIEHDIPGIDEDQIAVCFDFSRMQSCDAPGYRPENPHGMNVFGIIAARKNNEEALIAGIAPNARQMALLRPDFKSSIAYSDVLLWAAGFETGNKRRRDPENWPDEPVDTPADIINCSHGQKGIPLSGLVNDAFRYLTTHGRGGLGTVLVYGAGNDSSCITGMLVFADHPCTLAVGNSRAPDDDKIERHEGTSNWGPELDLCARGSGIWTLGPGGGPQRFGGTSAAAATVSAAVALMLSANPNLTWVDVRNILHDTARKIDLEIDDQGEWDENGFSQRYGYGRLNVARAVKAAYRFVPLSAPDGHTTAVPNAGAVE